MKHAYGGQYHRPYEIGVMTACGKEKPFHSKLVADEQDGGKVTCKKCLSLKSKQAKGGKK